LPKGSQLHPVFYISLLEPVQGPAKITEEVPQSENELDIYKIEEVLDKRHFNQNQQKEYLIK